MPTPGNKVAYFKGIRLWQYLKHWKPVPEKNGATRKIGTGRILGKLNPHSPCYFYNIAVHCVVEPQVGATYLGGDLGAQEVFNLQMLQKQKDLIEASGELGDLSWCQDEGEFLTVGTAATPGSYPGSASLSYTGSGFTPAIGQYVLLRDPDSGNGFVTQLTAVDTMLGSVTCVFKEEVSSGWEMVLVRFFFPDVECGPMAGWESATQAEDRHAFDVVYSFTSANHAVYKDNYVQDLS